jgi:dihydroxyacetone synthase
MAPSAVPIEELSAPAVNGAKDATAFSLSAADKAQVEHVVKTFRCLIADLCEQFKGGHPGGAMGMAAIGVALWKYAMRYSPTNPSYFNRDRFVLSNGHTCLFQYTFLHLTGYRHMTMDQLKSYHSARTDSFCPGHPEIEHPGIEVTTGPLGQGIANAVGLAMASKHLGATYNRPGFDVVDNMTYCMIGDACLQEGVALEAIQLAGHWKLNNLVVMYDNNQITCDGSVDLCNTEDVDAKMRACGWDVINIEDGNWDVEGIVRALAKARASRDRPTFINIRTIIGVGSNVAGDAKAHGAAFGAAAVADVKRTFGMDPEKHFVVGDEVYSYFSEAETRGARLEADYAALLEGYAREHPELAAEFAKRAAGEWSADWRALIPAKEDFPTTPTASRKSAGLVCNPIAAGLQNMMVGTADLSPSVNMIWKGKVDFQHVSTLSVEQ